MFKGRRTICEGREHFPQESAPFSCPRKGGVPNDIEGKNRIVGRNSLQIYAATRIFDPGALWDIAPQTGGIEKNAIKARNCSGE